MKRWFIRRSTSHGAKRTRSSHPQVVPHAKPVSLSKYSSSGRINTEICPVIFQPRNEHLLACHQRACSQIVLMVNASGKLYPKRAV